MVPVVGAGVASLLGGRVAGAEGLGGWSMGLALEAEAVLLATVSSASIQITYVYTHGR